MKKRYVSIIVCAAIIAALTIAGSNAMAGGDLSITTEWKAQKPQWNSTTTINGAINTALLTAWRDASGPSGPLCKAIWQQLTNKLDGAGDCLRNVYNLNQNGNNVCKLDQSPSISVTSTSGGITGQVVLKNNDIMFMTSLHDICAAIQDTGGDPKFNFTFTAQANVGLTLSNNQIGVGSATAQITSFRLSGLNNNGSDLIGAGNLLGAFNSLPSAITQVIDFKSQLSSAIAPANNEIAKVLTPLQGVGVSVNLVPDSSGVHIDLIVGQCLPGQTPGKFPCDNTMVCLTSTDWSKINKISNSCGNRLYCNGAGPSDRGPLPIDSWFQHGTYGCCGLIPTNLASSSQLVCNGATGCVAAYISFQANGPSSCPFGQAPKVTGSGWSCTTPTMPNCNVTCYSTYICAPGSKPPCGTPQRCCIETGGSWIGGKCTPRQ